MLRLERFKLEELRDALRTRGQRASVVLSDPLSPLDLIEAMRIVEDWGAFCEAMYLMMAADRRVMNVEREVLRGALAILSEERIHTCHMEAMLDAAARRSAQEGEETRLNKVIQSLKGDPTRAEMAVIVAAAVAAADNKFPLEEQNMLTRLFEGLNVDDTRASQILAEVATALNGSPAPSKNG